MDFLSKYLEYCNNNECPESYHLFSGLTVISALTGRKIWVDQGYWKHFGNLYTVLVGPAGNGKSVATHIAIKLMDEIGNVPTSSDCCSPRKLLEEMNEHKGSFTYKGKEVAHSSLVATPDELSNFISQDAKLMLDTLTAVWYRNRHKYSTAHHGSFEVLSPCLTILSCACPQWITQTLNTDMIVGGFSRRVLWVYERERSKVVKPSELVVTPQMQVIWEQLVKHGRKIQEVCGPFEWEKGSVEFVDEWYVAHKAEARADDGYSESKPGFVLKIAMLLGVAETLERVVRIKYVKKALEVLAVMERNLKAVFEGVGRNPLNAVANSVMELAVRAGEKGVSKHTVRCKAFVNATTKEYDDFMLHLRLAGKIEQRGDRWYALKQVEEEEPGDEQQQIQQGEEKGEGDAISEGRLKIVKSGSDEGVEAQRVAL